MDDLDYLFTTFAVAWVVIFAYILMLSFRQRKLQQKLNPSKREYPRSRSESAKRMALS